mmetsp:Transcript_18869/g.72717  ORF Transcript_18869/g.72717 Transcript_18869/m.72717 type:complete len:466 (-) Transcript_18869:307-1704(-)
MHHVEAAGVQPRAESGDLARDGHLERGDVAIKQRSHLRILKAAGRALGAARHQGGDDGAVSLLVAVLEGSGGGAPALAVVRGAHLHNSHRVRRSVAEESARAMELRPHCDAVESNARSRSLHEVAAYHYHATAACGSALAGDHLVDRRHDVRRALDEGGVGDDLDGVGLDEAEQLVLAGRVGGEDLAELELDEEEALVGLVRRHLDLEAAEGNRSAHADLNGIVALEALRHRLLCVAAVEHWHNHEALALRQAPRVVLAVEHQLGVRFQVPLVHRLVRRLLHHLQLVLGSALGPGSATTEDLLHGVEVEVFHEPLKALSPRREQLPNLEDLERLQAHEGDELGQLKRRELREAPVELDHLVERELEDALQRSEEHAQVLRQRNHLLKRFRICFLHPLVEAADVPVGHVVEEVLQLLEDDHLLVVEHPWYVVVEHHQVLHRETVLQCLLENSEAEESSEAGDQFVG